MGRSGVQIIRSMPSTPVLAGHSGSKCHGGAAGHSQRWGRGPGPVPAL